MTALTIRSVRPTGKHSSVCGHYDLLTYPPSPEGERLRDQRINRGLGVRAAAARMGITDTELGQLERDAATCDWAHAHRLLEGVEMP